jgi:hypothetical protein
MIFHTGVGGGYDPKGGVGGTPDPEKNGPRPGVGPAPKKIKKVKKDRILFQKPKSNPL